MWKVSALAKTGAIRPLVVIGTGPVLPSNNDFERKGFKVVAAFDNDPHKCGRPFGAVSKVEHISTFKQVVKDVGGAQVAILAVAGHEAHEMTRLMVESGISTILNYSPQNLHVPKHVKVLDMYQGNGNHAPTKSLCPPPFLLNAENLTPLLIPLARYKFGIYPPDKASLNNETLHQQQQEKLSLEAYFSESSHTRSRYKMDFVELELLGKGGYGSVYRAYNRLDDSEYAVKKIGINTDMKNLNEVRAMAKLNHPNIVRYFSSWIEGDSSHANDISSSSDNTSSFTPRSITNSGNTTNNDPYNNPCNESTDNSKFLTSSALGNGNTCSSRSELSTSSCYSSDISTSSSSMSAPNRSTKATLYIQMELCSRTTLRHWMSSPERIVELPQCLSLLTQLLDALNHVHKFGFIHRDVTPANLFIEEQGENITLKLGDFGLAKHFASPPEEMQLSQEHNDIHNEVSSVTNSTQTLGVGTYLYASPEQLTTTTYDSRSDMYSVGVILFELLQPFQTQMERVMTLTKLKAGLIATTFSILFPRECGFIQWLLCSDAAQRPSASQLLGQLSLN